MRERRTETAIVGRADELKRLLGLAEDPAVGAVLLTGPTGVGKSRLAEQVMLELSAQGWRSVGLSATEGGGRIPYASLSELIPDTLDQLDDERGDTGLTVLRAVEDALDLDGPQPVVTAIDDVASFDPPSCELLVHLATNRRLFIVATQSLDESLPEALRRLTPAAVVELDVEPLSITGTAALASTVLGGTAGPGLVRTLQARTRGNPLFIKELVTAGVAEGTIIERQGAHLLAGELSLTPTLGRQIMFRLGLLSSAERDGLELLALAGSLGVDDMESAAGPDEMETMERRGLIATYVDGRRFRVRLCHPLHAEAVLADVSPLVLRRRYRKLAGVVERHPTRRAEDAVLRARSQLAGGLDVAVDELVEAGYAALRLDRIGDATELARAAYRARPDEATLRAWTEVLIRQGRFVEADALMAEPQSADDEWQILRWSIRRSSNQLWGFNDPAGAWRIDEDCLATLSEPYARDRVDAHLAWIEYCDGRSVDAVERTDRLMTDPVEVHRHPDVRFAICVARAPALILAGRVEDGAELAQRAWDNGWGADTDYGSHGQHLIALGYAHLYQGDLEGTRFIVEQAIGYCRENNEATPLLFFLDLAATAELMAGRLTSALAYHEEARSIATDLAIAVSARSALAGAASALAQRGDREAAVNTLARLDDINGAPGPRYGLDIEAAAAWVAARSGDAATGARRLRTAADQADKLGLNTLTLTLLLERARLGFADADDAALADSAKVKVQGDFLPLVARAVAAAADHDGAGLDRVAASLDELGFSLWSTELSGMAADNWAAAGSQRSATASRRAADRTGQRIEPTATTAHTRLTAVDPLTRREREIALMAAEGDRNNEIAARLHVSIRTVETHLGRIYRKLGVASRRDLASALKADSSQGEIVDNPA